MRLLGGWTEDVDLLLTIPRMSDGASSILQNRRGELSVVDCGNRKASAKDAATRLLTLLGFEDLRMVSSFVITHWHQDHYNGLTELPSWSGAGSKPSAELYFPALPEDTGKNDYKWLLAAYRAHIALASGENPTPLPKVKSALERDYSLTTRALCRGHKVNLSGVDFDVLWPPRTLQGSLPVQVKDVIARVKDLSKKDPRFKKLVDEQLRIVSDEVEMRSIDGNNSNPVDQESDDSIQEDLQNEDLNLDHLAPESDEQLENFPDLRVELRKRLGRIANSLSLVLFNKRLGLLLPGDAPTSVLDLALEHMHLSEVKVMLAPHHGTYPLGKLKAAQPYLCVSQDGQVNPVSRGGHRHDFPTRCVETHPDGAVVVALPAFRPLVEPFSFPTGCWNGS